MSCSCRALFEPYVRGDGEIYAELEAKFPGHACENQTCSEFSPGPVAGDEQVIFLLVDPVHVDTERGITPGAFDELLRRDLSVIRRRFVSVGELRRTRQRLIDRGLEKTPPQLRMVDLACSTSVDDIRARQVDGHQAFGVYDTALPDQVAHASIFVHLSDKASKLRRKQYRSQIYELMSRIVIEYAELEKSVAAAV